MSLKLLTANIEGSRHLDRICSVIEMHSPDVMCFQEVFESDCQMLAAIGHYQVRFAISTIMTPATGHTAQPMQNWGVAVFTRNAARQQVAGYSDDPRIRLHREPEDPRRVLVITELTHDEQPYRIATTHFTWSAEGQINDEQRADFVRLAKLLAEYPDYVLCGDFNAPRGRDMFTKFTAELQLIDHLPASVTTTLDAQFHRAGALDFVVDTIFSTAHYRVLDIEVLSGISDHKGILATIERR